MSLNMYRSNLVRLSNDKAELEKRAAQDRDKMAKLRKDIFAIQQSITKNTSPTTLKSKQNQISSKEKDLVQVQKNLADTEKKIANKLAEITRALDNVNRAEIQEQKKQDTEAKNRRETELKHIKEITRETERQLQYSSQIQSHHLTINVAHLPDKIKVVFFAANPLNPHLDILALDEEIRAITKKIRAAEYRDSVELVPVLAVRAEDLQQALNEHNPHIIHFSGHGSEDELVFHNENGNIKYVSKEAIAFMISVTAKAVKVVIFNTCFSSIQAREVTQHVDIAIGMNDAISDDAGQIFAAQFYSAISFGKSVEEAFLQAKAELMLHDISEANKPQLFCRVGIDPSQVILVKP